MKTSRPTSSVAEGSHRACLVAGWFIVLLAIARGEETPSPSRIAHLADLSLEQLMEVSVETVVSASKYEQKITRAPASVTIVTAAEIAAYGHRTLAEVLRSVRGLYVADDSNYSYLGARGFLRPGDYNSRVLVLVDGHRMNENIYDSAYFGRDNAIAPEAIDRVEVIRGPSSSIYGSSAFLGVVNLVTKRGAQLDGAEISTEAGSFGRHRSRLSYGGRLASGAELALSASYYHSNGEPRKYYPEFDQRISPDPRATNDGYAENADAETALGFSGNFTYRDLTISASFSSRMKTVPTASFGAEFNDARNRTDDTRGYLDLALNREVRPDLRLLTRVFYDAYAYHGDYVYDRLGSGLLSDRILNKDRAFGDWVGTECQLTAKLLQRHTLVAGAEFRENLRQEQSSYYDTIPRLYNTDDARNSRTLALYAQGEFALGPQVLLNTGVRFDHYFGSFGSTVNPRVGLIYNPQERTTLKFLYGRAFRSPNVYERFYFPNPFTQLVPEKIHTFEIAAEHYFTRHHRVGLSVYRYYVSDLLTQTISPDGNIYFENLDRAEATGVELELEGKYSSGLRVRTSYALQRTKDVTAGTELTGSPRHLAKAGLIQSFARERYTAGLELQYHGTARTLAGATARAFTIGNLTLTARPLVKGVEVSASLYNLFDTAYGYPGGEDHTQNTLPQPGRTLRLKATYKF